MPIATIDRLDDTFFLFQTLIYYNIDLLQP